MRIEVTVVPAGPGVPVYEAPPWDSVLAKPVSWEAVEGAIEEALGELAESTSEQHSSLSGERLKAAASITGAR